MHDSLSTYSVFLSRISRALAKSVTEWRYTKFAFKGKLRFRLISKLMFRLIGPDALNCLLDVK